MTSDLPNQRLWDLVRYSRGPLHDAGLLTNEEYALLAADHDAVARLEDYDKVRRECDEARKMLHECFVLSGADTDGDGWEHTWPNAVAEVKELRKSYDEMLALPSYAELKASVVRQLRSMAEEVKSLGPQRSISNVEVLLLAAQAIEGGTP